MGCKGVTPAIPAPTRRKTCPQGVLLDWEITWFVWFDIRIFPLLGIHDLNAYEGTGQGSSRISVHTNGNRVIQSWGETMLDTLQVAGHNAFLLMGVIDGQIIQTEGK